MPDEERDQEQARETGLKDSRRDDAAAAEDVEAHLKDSRRSDDDDDDVEAHLKEGGR